MATTSLAGRRCFITGAASGIGRATARAAAREGAELFLTDVDAAGLEAVVGEIRAAGGKVTASRALDITDHAAVRRYAEEIHATAGSMDVVMNVAGIAQWGPVESLRHEEWRRCIDVNLMGPIHVIEAFVPAMIRARRGGHLVNVSSAAGLLGLPWHAPYSASKFGLRGVSEVLRFDLERHGIHVTLVCPGGVDTGLVDTVRVAGVDVTAPTLQKFKRSFRRRAVTPEEAARAILDGVRRRRYLVFTSPDIRLAHLAQRFSPTLYEWAMRFLNAWAYRLAATARPSGGNP